MPHPGTEKAHKYPAVVRGVGGGAQLELTDALREGLPSVGNNNSNIRAQKQFFLIFWNIAAWIYSHLRGFYDCQF